MSAVTELREAHEAAARKVDASARLIARDLLDERRTGVWPITSPDLDTSLRDHEANIAAETAARTAWMDARTATHNVSQNGR